MTTEQPDAAGQGKVTSPSRGFFSWKAAISDAVQPTQQARAKPRGVRLCLDQRDCRCLSI